MKPSLLLLAIPLVLLSLAAWGKGSCAGHGHCGHGHGVYAGHHGRGHDTDALVGLRKRIYSGYVVYGSDTLTGMIICTDNTISLKTSALQDSTVMYSIRDTNLYNAVLTDNGQTVELTRLEDHKLYRVLHAGKLSIYDNYFSMDRYSKKFFGADSRTRRLDNRSEELNSFWTTSVKKKLVNRINEVYGLALNPKDYHKKQLLNLIGTLD